MSILLICVYLFSFGHCQNKQRTINWWVNVVGNTATDQANVATIKEHKDVISQLQTAWQPGCTPDGDLSPWWLQAEEINVWLKLYKPLNIPIVPAAVCIVNSTTMHNVVYPNATGFANALVNIAKSYGFAGFTFDYEPQWPVDNNANSAELYKDFLTTVASIFHTNGLVLTVWVANWSKALSNFGLLAESGVDELQDMETYGNPNYSFKQELEWMFGFLDSIGNDNKDSLSQAGVGLGCYQTSYWNYSLLNQAIGNMTQHGGYKIDIFRLLMDGKNNWPPNYWWTSLEMFMNGTL
eukprot:194932_1